MPPAVCRWCDQPIHRRSTDPASEWVHAQRATARCNDGQHDAEPREQR